MTRGTARDALLVNVATLLAEPAGSSRDLVFGGVAVDLGPDLGLARPIDARFRLARTNRGLLVHGDVRTALSDVCSRCLRPIEVELEAGIDEEALPSVELTTGAPVDTTAEPEVARLSDHHEIDLEPFVVQAIQLAVPIAPLCRPDCPGLCSVCGIELDRGSHDHPDEEIDPRLEALRAFRVDGGRDPA